MDKVKIAGELVKLARLLMARGPVEDVSRLHVHYTNLLRRLDVFHANLNQASKSQQARKYISDMVSTLRGLEEATRAQMKMGL